MTPGPVPSAEVVRAALWMAAAIVLALLAVVAALL